MAHLLGAQNLRVSFGTRTVLDGVSVGVEDGDRIGMVGRNGDGKSTLMRLLAQQQSPDEGQVTHRNGLRVGFLNQRDVLDGDLPVGEAIVGDAADHEWASNPRVREVMGGLVAEVDWHARVSSLSGGQRRRVALAKLLIGEHDVIMLDEPTNHLDVEGVAWLAGHLKQRWRANQGGLLVVTHDRWFLDEVSTRTWEVHDGVIDPFDGGYAAYVLARAERDRMAAVVENKRQQLVKKELAWLRRGAPARTSKPKFRIDAANELIADVPAPRDSMQLAKMATARLGKDVIDLEDVSLSFASGAGDDAGARPLFDRITLRLAPGERVGIVGVNGAGKSTLLRLLAGEVTPDAGTMKRGKTVQAAVLTQEVKELDALGEERLIEVIKAERQHFQVQGREISAGQLVEQLGFTQQKQWTKIKELSGGERRRLQLLRLLVGEPNVLMLDEPTNDLDTDTLAAIEDLLDGWPGTLVVVSHDRYLLERVTDYQLALLGDGKIRHLPGGVDQYLELRAAAAAAGGGGASGGSAGSASPTSSGVSTPRPTQGATDTGGEQASSYSEAERREARKTMNRLEKQMEKVNAEIAHLEGRMAAASEALKFDELTDLTRDHGQAQAQHDELEMQWLEAAEIAEG